MQPWSSVGMWCLIPALTSMPALASLALKLGHGWVITSHALITSGEKVFPDAFTVHFPAGILRENISVGNAVTYQSEIRDILEGRVCWGFCLLSKHVDDNIASFLIAFNSARRPVNTVLYRNTCLVGLLIRSILRGKNCTSASARVQFFQRKIERINRPTRHVLLESRICFLYEQQHHAKCWWISNLRQIFQPEILPEIHVAIHWRHVL